MALEVQKDKINLSSVTHSMRASQAILQYGVGAMIDFPDQTLMAAAPEYWQSQIEDIHDVDWDNPFRIGYIFHIERDLGSKIQEGPFLFLYIKIERDD